MLEPLPIDHVLPEVLGTLERHRCVVLAAPPGAGKTTRLPPALLGEPWVRRKVLMLQPRRVAARAAAARIADEQGWTLGQQVGYRVHLDRRCSPDTRIEVITEGILTRKLQADPWLEDTDVVVLDEFHERSIHSDLGLALLKEVQCSVRKDLRIVVMSATLRCDEISAYLNDCPVVEAEVACHPLETIYARRKPTRPLAQTTSETVRRALIEDPARGDVLVFLPGAGEIRRCAALLADLSGIEVVPLHGGLAPAEQDRALRVGKTRRVVLATNVAETSITVQGVSCVVDSGLARILRHDPRYGLDTLAVSRISQASAAQRAGRAGRLGPGRAYRLWTEADQVSLPAYTPPEVRRVDLAAVVLELRAWGTHPDQFDWLEAPEPASLTRAEQLLRQLGALERRTGAITPEGKAMLGLPVHPRLACVLLESARKGCLDQGAAMAALLSERDIVNRGSLSGAGSAQLPTTRSDVLLRLELLDGSRGQGLGSDAQQWVTVNGHVARRVLQVRDDLRRRVGSQAPKGQAPSPPQRTQPVDDDELLALLLAGYPDRVVRRRSPESHRGVMVGGHGVALGRFSTVREAPLFLALDLEASGREAQVDMASEVHAAWLETRVRQQLCFDEHSERVTAFDCRMYGDLCLSRSPCAPDPVAAAQLLAERASRELHRALGLDGAARQWIARAQWLASHMPELELPPFDDAWLSGMLPELCVGKASFSELANADLASWLSAHLTHGQRQALRSGAPHRLQVPSGRHIALCYREGQPPVLAVRLQEMFGSRDTPRLAAGRAAVLLHLLAPNGRPVQITQDLESFWRSTYPEVRPALRARYPKHAWPEDPLSAHPQSRPARRRKST